MKLRSNPGKFEGNFKLMLLRLLFAFCGSFLGAVWGAYMALRMGANVHTWVPISLAGAIMVCSVLFAMLRSYAPERE